MEEYTIKARVTCVVILAVTANSEEEAAAKAEEKIKRGDWLNPNAEVSVQWETAKAD